MEDNAAVYQLATVQEPFKSKVVHEQIGVDIACEAEQGGHHLLVRPDGVDKIDIPVKTYFWGEDIILYKPDPGNTPNRPDIRAKHFYSPIVQDQGDFRVLPDAYFRRAAVMFCDVGRDAMLNTFKPRHIHLY